MFSGEYQYKVDDKGRVPFPPKFREQLKEGLVLSRGLEKCITVYPMEQWRKVSEKLATLPPARSNARRMNRYTFGMAFESEFDAQGRVALPSTLRQHAEISNAAVVVGVNNYMEIWSKGNWDEEFAQLTDEVWQISESLEDHS